MIVHDSVGIRSAAIVCAALALAWWAPVASAFLTWSAGKDVNGSPIGNCARCHGDFFAPFGTPGENPYSARAKDDPADWGNNLMFGHTNKYSLSCSDCHHITSSVPVYLNPRRSINPGYAGTSCVDCHGRVEDAANPGSPAVRPDEIGNGLRARHEKVLGIGACSGCHANSSIALVGETVPPSGYLSRGIDPCDENGAGVGTGNFGLFGLDNDGDGFREINDSDCQVGPLCGNGILEPPGEECDDGNFDPGDGCDALCQLEPLCGNGVLDPGEECEDTNQIDGDGCNNDCTLTVPACP